MRRTWVGVFLVAAACGGDGGSSGRDQPVECPDERTLYTLEVQDQQEFWWEREDGVVDGPYQRLRGGLLVEEGAYNLGAADGVWHVYDQQQRLMNLRQYRRGLRCGTWEDHVGGQLVQTVEYPPCDGTDLPTGDKVAPNVRILDSETACGGSPMQTIAVGENQRLYCEGGGAYQIRRAETVLVQGELDAALQVVGEMVGFYDDGSVRFTAESRRENLNAMFLSPADIPTNAGVASFYRSDRTLDAEGELVNGAREGAWTTYWNTGAVASEGTWSAGQKNGSFTEYDPAGGVLAEVSYAAGRLDGPAKHYYDAENLESEGSYGDGYKEGPWTSYFPDGKTRASGSYLHGGQDGAWEYFDAEGRIKLEATFVAGIADGEWKGYDYGGPDGDGYEILVYRAGLASGTWRGYLADDRLIYEQEWAQDQRNGAYRAWHPNGERAREGQYGKDISLGLWSWWHDNGQLAQQGEVYDDVPIGAWIKYWPNGQRRAEGTYRGQSGQKEPGWLYWDEDGNSVPEEL